MIALTRPNSVDGGLTRTTPRFYADENFAKVGIVLDPITIAMKNASKRCDFCDHSRAAHIDGIRCALCTCISQRREFVQQSLTFRDALPMTPIKRKR